MKKIILQPSRLLVMISALLATLLAAGHLLRSEQEWSRIFVRCGDQAFKRGHFDEAFENYDKALKMDPSNRNVRLKQVQRRFEMGDCRGALETFPSLDTHEIEIPADYYYKRGECYMKLGDPLSAIQIAYSLAIAANPGESQYYYKRALAHQSMQEDLLAESDFKKAKELESQAS